MTRPIQPAVFIFLFLFLLFSLFIACDSEDNGDSEQNPPAGDDDTESPDDDIADDDAIDDDMQGERLYAGATSGYLKVPIGISLGGFGARIGFKTAYNEKMGGSRGYLDRPNTKAVALKRGDQFLVFAKASVMGVTESLRTQIVNQVYEQTGVNLDRSLIINAVHTHSGPARFFALPDIMSLVGMDKYSQEIVDRIAGSITEVIVEAMTDMQPARIGFGYREPFDPDYRLTADRRCANGPGDFKENRLWVGLVETDDGETMAVLAGMAMHGVVFGYGTFNLTGDAPDGVERAIEKMYDHPVTAMYVQGSSGDVVPKMWSPVGHRRWQIIEWIGSQVASIVRDVQEEIITDDQPELKVITQRYVTDRETLGYQPGEFGHTTPLGQFIEYEKGAMECGVLACKNHGSINDCDNPETTLVDGYLGCLVDLSWPFANEYVDFFMQSAVTVAQIGDQYFFTAPGEITSHLAVDIRHSMAETLNVPFENVNTIGYAQNYIFYILQDWDWWQGGGEMEGSLFGWRFGPWLQSEVNRLAGWLKNDYPPAYDDPLPNLYQRALDPVLPEKSEKLGEVETQPYSELSRFDIVRFAWHGGHPGVDWLTVTLQRNENDEWVDVLRPNGTPYDDKGWEMAVSLYPTPDYRQEEHRDSRDFLYELEWETSWDDPDGILRFKVNGTAKNDGGIQSYELFSEQFMLSSVDSVMVYDLAADVQNGPLHIQATAAYPPDPPGRRRIRSPLAGGTQWAIVSGGHAVALIQDSQNNKTECELTYDVERAILTGDILLDHLTGPLTITIDAGSFDDGYGNTNSQATDPILVQW